MATRKKSAGSAAKKTATKRAPRGAGFSNGMTTFALHAFDEGSKKMLSKLKDETTLAPSFAIAAAVGGAGPEKAAAVDPETAARGYLSRALESDAVPSLVAPVTDTGATDFKVINTETVPLTNTVMV